MAESLTLEHPDEERAQKASASSMLQVKTGDADYTVETTLSSNLMSASSSPETIEKGNISPTKPSILRNPIHRLRRRKRPTIEVLVKEEGVIISSSDAVSAAPFIENDKTTTKKDNEEEEKQLEEYRTDEDVEDVNAAVHQTKPASPKISIVLEHDNEVVVEQLLPFASKAKHASSSTTTKHMTSSDNPEDLFYSPLKLVSPKVTTNPQRNQRQCKSIIKRGNSKIRTKSNATLLSTTSQRRVSFDEATIVKHESARKRKSAFETIRLAMPIILPYLIAILILVVSSLVPPAVDTTVSSNVEQAAESVSTSSDTNQRSIMGGLVTVSASSSSDESEPKEDPIIADHNDGRDCGSSATSSTSTVTRTLWTPHSMYDQVVLPRTFNHHRN
ncbi:hypothetical protein IV203_023653 [Nitzschia inconspicua]|uniref:Uncharacterized protein n=1 Tax=Nitzschia inconspicua TaxID=303405 RepID=A0A9K3KEL2_9STRA|nr:hypothetical protein IV203_023653 [Nitzschia inconspicua]